MSFLSKLTATTNLSSDEMNNLKGGAAKKNSIGLDNNVVTIMMKKYASSTESKNTTIVSSGEVFEMNVDTVSHVMCFTNSAGKSFKVRF